MDYAEHSVDEMLCEDIRPVYVLAYNGEQCLNPPRGVASQVIVLQRFELVLRTAQQCSSVYADEFMKEQGSIIARGEGDLRTLVFQDFEHSLSQKIVYIACRHMEVT